MPLTKTISFPPEERELYEWLETQPNQSLAIREGLRLLREQKAGKGQKVDLSELREKLDSIMAAIDDLRTRGVSVPQQIQEDQEAVDILLDLADDEDG